MPQPTVEDNVRKILRMAEQLTELGVITSCRINHQKPDGFVVEVHGVKIELNSYRELVAFISGISTCAQFLQKRRASALMNMRISISEMTVSW